MNLARNIAIITLAVMVILGVIIRLVMRFITSPLLSLTAASQRLADEDYDVKLNYRSKDEIGQLTQAFNLMRDKIKDYIADLNLRVSEVISTYVYKQGLGNGSKSDYAYSTAVDLFNSVINLALVISVNRISKKVSETSLW